MGKNLKIAICLLIINFGHSQNKNNLFVFKQIFNKLKIKSNFYFNNNTTREGDDFVVSLDRCLKEFYKGNIKIKRYGIFNKTNSIVIVEYIFKDENTAYASYSLAYDYANKIRTTDEQNINSICSRDELRWDRFIYAVKKNSHIFLFGYQNETKYEPRSVQYSIDRDKSILIDDLVEEFEKMK